MQKARQAKRAIQRAVSRARGKSKAELAQRMFVTDAAAGAPAAAET